MYVCVRVIILFVYWTVVLLRHPRGVQAEERSCTLGVPTLSLVRYYFRLEIFVLSLFYVDLGSRVTNSLNSKTSSSVVSEPVVAAEGSCLAFTEILEMTNFVEKQCDDAYIYIRAH